MLDLPLGRTSPYRGNAQLASWARNPANRVGDVHTERAEGVNVSLIADVVGAACRICVPFGETIEKDEDKVSKLCMSASS